MIITSTVLLLVLHPCIMRYFVASGKAASIADMCITPTEFLQRMGDYNQYCPVVSLAPMYHELFVIQVKHRL